MFQFLILCAHLRLCIRSDPAYDVFGFRHDMALDAGSESALDTVEKRVTQRASQIDVSFSLPCIHVYDHSY